MNKVLIYGGLGNQMFQYALFLALKNKGIKTNLSISNFFFYDDHNGFNLAKAFKIKSPFPSNIEVFFLINAGFFYKASIIRGVLRRVIPWYRNNRYRIYKEREEFLFDNDLFYEKSVLFVGTWQVEAYFKDIAGIVLEAFTFAIPTDDQNRMLIEKITSSNSVCIHIRKGDFLSDGWRDTHEVIKDTTYYLNSIRYLEERFQNLHFFVFSDDMTWVKENFSIPNCTFVDQNKGEKSYIDMYLMSLCKHNIIANSTFSWWGAWLNTNNNKIVIMPEKWLLDNTCSGIFPKDWIKMPV